MTARQTKRGSAPVEVAEAADTTPGRYSKKLLPDPATLVGKSLLTIDDAAATLSYSRRQVTNLIKRGRLKVVREGRSVRITQQALSDYIKKLTIEQGK